MPGVIDRLVYEVGYDVDKSSFDNVAQGVKKISDGFKTLTKVAGLASTAIFGLTAFITDQAAEHQRLANAMGVSQDTTEAFGNEMKKIGGTTENFLDLIEEMNNKFGELKGLGELGTAEEALQILNLRFEDLERLSPEEQFKAVTDAALGMADAQEAATAVDMLMGGEANKLISTLRAQGLTYDEVIRKQKAMSFETEESRAASLQFANAMTDLMNMLTNLARFVAGTLAPVFSDVVTSFIEWSAANKEVISSGIREFINALSAVLSGLWTVLRTVGNILATVIDALGGLGNVIRLIISTGIVLGIVKVAQAIAFIGIAAKRATFSLALLNKTLRILRNLLLIGALVAIFEDLWGWIEGTDSVMGRMVGTFDEWKGNMIEGLKQLGSLIVSALLSPVNLVIEAVNTLIAGLNLIPTIDIPSIKTITPGDVTGGILEGQATAGELAKQALGFNTPGSFVNNIVDSAANTANNVANSVDNTINVVVNAASADADTVARLVGAEVSKVTNSAAQSLETRNK